MPIWVYLLVAAVIVVGLLLWLRYLFPADTR